MHSERLARGRKIQQQILKLYEQLTDIFHEYEPQDHDQLEFLYFFPDMLAMWMAENNAKGIKVLTLVGEWAVTYCDLVSGSALSGKRKCISAEAVQKLLKIMDYESYLQTAHWKETRKAALARANQRCQVCNSPKNLNVHHRTYERRGAELPEDLTVLCKKCHELFHKSGKLAVDE